MGGGMRPGAGVRNTPIERASSIDMMQLASEVGPAPSQVGAILVLDAGSQVRLGQLRQALAERIPSIPRLRQQLVRAPLGCGRPTWTDDPAFDVAGHVHEVRCSAPGTEDDLLRVAADIVTHPLPPGQPLWSATLVSGLKDRSALVIVFNHVLADGMGGLAVLANLVDGASRSTDTGFPRPSPSWWQLASDALTSRARALAHLWVVPSRVREALAELRSSDIPAAPRCSLNRPVGSRRALGVARADLGAIRSAAHAHRATVNDAVLAAVSGAMTTLLAHRGEYVDHFVAMVPVSARTDASAAGLGNQVGATPVALPADGDWSQRIEAIAADTRRHKGSSRGASAFLLAPLFRGLAWLGAMRWFTEHQHRVTTFVSNLRGPETRLSLLGATINEIIPLVYPVGNVPVAFGILSYAGTITVAVIADADACPDLNVLVDGLQHELDAIRPQQTFEQEPAAT